MKFIIFKGGSFRHSNKNDARKSEISLSSWLKRMLTYFGVPMVDPCCEAPGQYPMRFNPETGEVSAYMPGMDGTYDWFVVGVLAGIP